MKLSKILIATTLLIGASAPIVVAVTSQKEMVAAQADGTKDLASIISYKSCSFNYSYISNFFFDFNLSEQIFTNSGYFNDHLTDGTYKNANNQNINIGEGIEINGKTLQYWVNYTPETISYPRNSGVTAFPLYAGNKFNPVAVEVSSSKISFKVDINTIPMDDITVTFKAGIFEGYYNGTTFTLSEDLTFYSVATQNGGPARVTFVSSKTWQPVRNAYRSLVDWGEKTASQGGKYHKYLMWTDIPFDKEVIKQACPADNYRYIYDNLLMNGKSIAYYNSWARGNSKDFTDLSDVTTQNPDYEVSHPLGNTVSTTYDLAIRIEIVRDQPVYAFVFSVPNQLVTDLSLGTLSFSLREGASFLTKDNDGNFMIGRIDSVAFNTMAMTAYQELEDYVNLDNYAEPEQLQICEILSNAQASIQNAFSQSEIDAIIAQAKLDIDDVMSPEEKLEQEHIAAVVALINAIPTNIEYTEECGNAINLAMEAYASLTASEINKFPAESLNKLYEAYAAFSTLDLANYKLLSKAEIATVDLNDYRELQQSAITDLLAQANTAIDAATNKAEVQLAVDNFFAAINQLPTDAQLSAQELALVKANAKDELDAIDLSVYATEQRAQVEELITNGKIAIDQCQTVEEVNTLLNKIKTVIGSIKTANDLANEQANLSRQQYQQNAGLVTAIVIGSLALILGMGLAIFLIRRRQLNK